MRIRRLQVRDLRRYRELDIDLAPGVTVVRGPNEAGKSTIQRAIELALTRRVTSSAGDLETLRPWDASADTRPWVAIEFEQEEEDGRLATGTLEKWFGGQKGTVDLVYDGQRVTDPALADQVLAELSGVPTEAFFRSTASVRHHELSDLARDEAALRDRLQASISGADRGTGRAKKKLERAIYELTTKGDKNPGRLKLAESAVASTAETRREGRARARPARARPRHVVGRARPSARSPNEPSPRSERCSRRPVRPSGSRPSGTQPASATSASGKRSRSPTELDELAQTHPSPNPLPVIRQAVDRLRVLDTRMRELRAALAGEVDVNFEVAPEPTWRPISRWGVIAVVVGLADRRRELPRRPAWTSRSSARRRSISVRALALVGVILSGVALWLRRGSEMQDQLRDVEIDRRLRGRSEMEAELELAEADTEQQLGALGLDDLVAAEDLLGREEAHVARIDQLVRPARRPRRQGAARDVAEAARRRGARDRAEDERARGARARSPRSHGRASGSRSRSAIRRRPSTGRATTRRMPGPGSRPTRSMPSRSPAEAERLAVWREQLAVLQRRHRVLEATLRAIERAETATMKTATRYLEGHMVRDVSTVTGGRYRRVRVDDKTLDIDVHAPERGDWVPVSDAQPGHPRPGLPHRAAGARPARHRAIGGRRWCSMTRS